MLKVHFKSVDVCRFLVYRPAQVKDDRRVSRNTDNRVTVDCRVALVVVQDVPTDSSVVVRIQAAICYGPIPEVATDDVRNLKRGPGPSTGTDEVIDFLVKIAHRQVAAVCVVPLK